MGKDQIATLLGALGRLEADRAALLRTLLGRDPLLRGSLTHLHQRCGNPGCHCATKPCHPVTHLSTSRDGKQRCQLIRQADVETVRVQVARYRDFRSALRRLDAIHREQKGLLRGVMEFRDVGYE